ncbi:MAG: DUF3772 domain-containing protein [Pseudomonadota bacterium]
MVLVRILCVWLALFWACLAFAQEVDPQASIDYAAWSEAAQLAEASVSSQRSSVSWLETQRARIVGWRARFLEAQSVNQTRIATITQQVEALGPLPEEGTTEEAEIAERRTELQNQLAQLRAPQVRAEEAFKRADGLVQEIDTLVRERQTQALLSANRSPLNPSTWGFGVAALQEIWSGLGTEVRTAWQSEAQQEQLRAEGPFALMFIVIAAVLLFRGGAWIEALLRRVVKSGYGFTQFGVSLGEIILPGVGLIALSEAAFATGLFGPLGETVIAAALQGGLAYLIARWIGGQILPRDGRDGLLRIAPEQRGLGRWLISAAGLIMAVVFAAQDLADYARWSAEARAVLMFPLIVVMAWQLYRISGLLRRHLRATSQADEERGFRDTLINGVAIALLLVSVLGPILAALGYGPAAEALVQPAALSMALLAVIWIVQQQIFNLYSLLTGRTSEEARDALLPVLAGFVLMLCSFPAFTLIWGARVSDLTEVWTQFLGGFEFGGTRISPSNFLLFAIVFVIGYTLTRLLQRALKGSILPKTKLDAGGQNAVTSGVGYLGIFLAALIAVTTAGIDLSGLAIVAGALSVGIGFGLQNIVSNFVSGIILLVERPIGEGDWVEVGGHMGIVKDISVRSTRIETFDRTDVIIPNADFVSGTVTNYTRGNNVGRLILEVGVAYGTNTRRVEEILQEIAESHPMVLLNPKPFVHFKGFGADSLDFDMRLILRDINNGLGVRKELNHRINERFVEEGIEIPFAQRDVWLRNPETLQPAPKASPKDLQQAPIQEPHKELDDGQADDPSNEQQT